MHSVQTSSFHSPFYPFLHVSFSFPCRYGAGSRFTFRCQPHPFRLDGTQNLKSNLSKWCLKTTRQLLTCATKSLSRTTRNIGDKTMCIEYVSLSQKMANDLLNSEFKGAGDTIEAAAYRVQTKWHAPASILLRLRHRAAQMRDMKVSSWFAIFEAYQRACAKAERKYEIARASYEMDPALVRLADLVAGQKEKDKT